MTQKPTYAQLEERINEYRLLTDHMADIVWMTDLEMATTYVSPSIERTLGFSQEERKRLPLQDLMTAESLKRVSEIFLKEIQKEQSNNADPNRSVMFDVEYFCKDSSTKWIENNVQGIRNREGILTGFSGVSRDITKRKQAETALQESEARYRLHFEHSFDVIYSLDREFKLLDVSPSVERMLGFKPDELIGRPFQEINVLAPEYLEPAFSDTIRVLGGERINSSVYQFIAKDGTRKWGEISGSPLIRDGKVIGVISVARDITDRIDAEAALKASEANYRTIFDTANDAIFIHHMDTGKILDVNRKMCEMYGYTSEETRHIDVGTISEGVPPYSQKEAIEWIQKAEKGIPQIFEWRAKSKGGGQLETDHHRR